jgi:hypothetical protein
MQMDCEEVDGEALITCSDAAKTIQSAEHALNGIAVAIEHGRGAVFPTSIGLWRHVRHGAGFLNLTTDHIAAIARVSMRLAGICFRAIRDLATGQQEGDRAAEAIGQGMNFLSYARRASARSPGSIPPLRQRLSGGHGTPNYRSAPAPAGRRHGPVSEKTSTNTFARPANVAIMERLALGP